MEDLLNLLKNNDIKFDLIIVCAAIANYIPKKHNGKIWAESEFGKWFQISFTLPIS